LNPERGDNGFNYRGSRTEASSNTFQSKPKACDYSTVAKPGSIVKLFTNQYRLTLGQELSVYQYDVSITPDVMQDSYIIHNIFRRHQQQS